MLAQLAHRRKAVVALLLGVATFIVAVAADSTAGHIAAALLVVVNGAAVHQVTNRKRPARKA